MKIESNIHIENTFKVSCVADSFVRIKNKDDFAQLLQTATRKDAPKRLFVGGGSNMLLTRERYEGLVVHNAILGKNIISDNNNEVIVNVGGGENRDAFVRWTVEQGLCGIENLVSIPGTVGAAPIQNIGAYGVEAKDSIVSVGGIDASSGEYKVYSNEDCQFAYRDSIFKQMKKDAFFVTDVTFRLHKYVSNTYVPNTSYGAISDELNTKGISTPTPHDIATTVAAIRASKLPDLTTLGTAGSFFKNIFLTKDEYDLFIEKLRSLKPNLEIMSYDLGVIGYKIPTGWLLDKVLELRGHRDGDVGCYEKQALCLVNYGSATGQEIVDFSKKLQNECVQTLGVQIEPEVNVI